MDAPLRRDAQAGPRKGAVIVAAWTVVAVVFAGHNYLPAIADGRPVPLSHVLWWSAAE